MLQRPAERERSGDLRVSGVDRIVMAARAHAQRRRMLGSVSAEVASEAPCSVTVVRARAGTETLQEG